MKSGEYWFEYWFYVWPDGRGGILTRTQVTRLCRIMPRLKPLYRVHVKLRQPDALTPQPARAIVGMHSNGATTCAPTKS